MKTMRKRVLLATSLFLWGLRASAQSPLEKPLADFDELVSQLKTSSVVGEPIRVGDSAVIPFTEIKFTLGGGGAMIGFGGAMGRKTVPLGILIVEGDDVRAELLPAQEEKPTLLQETLRAILDRKVVFMGNGLNIGHASGTVQDLAPLISGMMGQTTVLGNALNLGGLDTPASTASSARNASLNEVKILFRAMGAMEEFERALALDADNPDAYLGRGVARLMAPPEFGGNVDGAIADFEAAIARKASSESYYYLGEALKKKGLKDKAAGAYRKALELQPENAEASKALAATK
jgi:uncharacterized spore protein YtfJ